MHRLQVFLALVVAVAVTAAVAVAARAPLRANGVQVQAPAGWDLVEPSDAGSDGDPRTVLVAGTEGVAPRRSECQVASYRLPVDGAVVVVLRWAGRASDLLPTDRDVLAALKLRRETFSCFDGRGGAVLLALRGRAYQVNVMVGDKASGKTVAAALAAARSFDTVR